MSDDVLPELRPFGPIMGTHEVAEILGINAATASRLCAAGDLPAFRVGRQWKVRRSELQRVILGQWTKGEDMQQDS